MKKKIQHLQDIKALQFELWHNCNNNCDFCYLKEGRVISTPEQQVENIKKVRKFLETTQIDSYQAIGLIGGEFFEGQLSNNELKKEFNLLIEYIQSLDIIEFWLTASLIDKNQDDLWETLNTISSDKILILCTSYDTIGRFKSKEQEEQWFENISIISNIYDNVTLHTQIILTQDFINYSITDMAFLNKIAKLSTIDFRLPTLTLNDINTCIANINSTYTINRELQFSTIMNNIHKYPENFFIYNRSSFLNCIKKLIQEFGIGCIDSLRLCREKSDDFYQLSCEIVKIEYCIPAAPCGHGWENYCYLDSANCVKCDIQNLYDELKD